MEEIKVGEYIRLINGQIAKVINIKIYKKTSNVLYTDIILDLHIDRDCNENLVDEDEVVKHSFNIIDLIEEGDFVNGEKVCKSRYDELYTSYVYCGGIGVRTTEEYTTFIKDMKEEEIESIVTKEQFENMEYKVEEQ